MFSNLNTSTYVTGTSSGFVSSDINQNIVVTTIVPTRKKREKIDPMLNFSLYKPNEYKKYLIDDPYEVIENNYVRCSTRTFFFKKIWITGIYYNLTTDEFIDIKPRKQLCRLFTTTVNSYIKMDYVDDIAIHDSCIIQIYDCSFNSKKIKKCFTEEEAIEQYVFLRKEYMKKLKKDKDKIDNFIKDIHNF